MKFLVVSAMSDELYPLINNLDLKSEDNIFVGKCNDNEILAVVSGIGKVNCSVILTQLITKYNPDVVVNIGSAGGLGVDINVGDIIFGDDFSYFDVDVTVFDYSLGQIPGMPKIFKSDKSFYNDSAIKIGQIISGDSFICNDEKIKKIINDFPNAIALDMESASMAHTCFILNKRFIAIRGITDKADNNSSNEHVNNLKSVSEKVVQKLINIMS